MSQAEVNISFWLSQEVTEASFCLQVGLLKFQIDISHSKRKYPESLHIIQPDDLLLY